MKEHTLEEKQRFWRQNKVIGPEGIELDRTHYSPEDIVSKIAPYMTEERRQRIEQVLLGRTRSIIPVMENIYDRGNISAAMRSAEAYGFLEFHIIEAKDARFKSANRVTQGADKWLDVKEFTSTESCLDHLKQRGYKIYATDLTASKPISEIDFTEPSALIFGNEKDGISDQAREMADANIILPMTGFAQSFNISVAAALSFYHIWLYRQQRLDKNGDLSQDELNLLRANYYYKAVKSPDMLLKSR